MLMIFNFHLFSDSSKSFHQHLQFYHQKCVLVNYAMQANMLFKGQILLSKMKKDDPSECSIVLHTSRSVHAWEAKFVTIPKDHIHCCVV